ncbi:MAG: SDR family oxidoreductase [Roseiflexaceae bacterium]|nr:SDR family oxidoreductase [Roseiflexaceae bacterium]
MTAETPRIALITGANKGIGFEIARQFGAQGMTVLIGARDSSRGQAAVERLQAEGATAHVVPIDVTETASITAAARTIEAEWGRLDILVNNAGILLDTVAPSQLDHATFERTYATNVYGVFAVTQAMLPLLRLSKSARIVNMSSGLGSLTWTSDQTHQWSQIILAAYNSSKAAVNALTVQFANELRATSIKVNSADPGYCATDLNGFTGPRSAAQGAQTAVRLATLPADGPTGGFFNDDGLAPW